jgi:hypothetical protein
MLINCRECGSKVSDEARKCPHCGCPGPGGEYSYRNEDGDRIYVNEKTSYHCDKCGRITSHRRYSQIWDMDDGCSTGSATWWTCKVCGHEKQESVQIR